MKFMNSSILRNGAMILGISAMLIGSAAFAQDDLDLSGTDDQTQVSSQKEGRGKGGKGGMKGRMNRASMRSEYDTDGDGTVTDAEKAAFITKYDTDGDGQLSYAERKVAREAVKSANLAKIDTDGDGTVSKEERTAAREAFRAAALKKLDTDGDGVVSDTEKEAAKAAREAAMAERRAQGLENLKSRLDTDATFRERFLSRHDSDGDGTLSDTEIEAASQQKRGGMRGNRGSGQQGQGVGSLQNDQTGGTSDQGLGMGAGQGRRGGRGGRKGRNF
ncbi:MAG: hypothetical protein CVV64_14720 [Candidatus Wallbacteria bacterium HGW-Wallbacteria-1]|jgi:Ca2+-binding EF-hand superfamily protein|uniref:EF-hand domain-containing protein n=1 Tax=Candidatus Wallbacteria bacterium HGW-Wallbacteria-1 TaxID=2013854 RepID=A0A2N1PM29_9BACT|nr:MAG: hypothetical protein CVV64_14720 [Candidatus Wallbacteria bacterium HGW-Wallbacteria-1]